ncbi:MAG TPA: ABC transporter ATP-binding protein [Anaerolineae bacterium]|nr:ABC transporter ATP-binding protein [Anaerolineae bacterium]HNU05395.1 ABC transporter ATP-binding protein [Anaerolineae bacterium]
MHGGGWRSYISHDPNKSKPRVDRALLQRVLGYARPYWWMVLLVLAAIIAISLIELLPPLILRQLIDVTLPTKNLTQLHRLALALLAVPVVSGLIDVGQRYFSAKMGEGIIFDLRQQMYGHLSRMALRFFTHTKSGEIISRFNNDVVGAQNAITGTIPNMVVNVVTVVSTLVIMISIDWRLTLLAIAVAPLFLLPAKRVAGTLRTIRRQAMDANAEQSNIITETLGINGALLVKTFGRQQQEEARFRTVNAQVRDLGVRRALVGRWFFMGLSLSAAVGTALVYWVGGQMVIADALTIGTIVAFAAYLARLYGPISSLSNIQVEFAQSMVSFERVFEYLDVPAEIEDAPNARVLEQVAGHIRFADVSFSYLAEAERLRIEAGQAGQAGAAHTAPAEQPAMRAGRGEHAEGAEGEAPDVATVATRTWALRHFTAEIMPGQLVALVGRSGAGKTTVTYLLPRLYDVNQGAITIDGHDLRAVTQQSLAEQIGLVMQETYLFHDTIRRNLLYARPEASEEEMIAAAKAASIHSFIAKLPAGYDTVVGERGYRLSGGEKQRLAIARVILKDPRILILDEATSHLDSENEALIQEALAPLFRGRTSVVIAHRLSTILAADTILVLDEGRLVESGSHEELLAQGSLYAHLYETQFRQGEAG